MGGKKQKRVSRSTVLYIPASALTIVLLVSLGIGVFMKVLDIRVIGTSIYSDEQIISASGIMPGDNTLFINTEAASRMIHKEMPYIRDAKITRKPPSTIIIEVTASKALAAITFQNSVLVVDSDCKLLSVSDKMPDGLIVVTGLLIVDPAVGSPLKVDVGNDKNLQYLKDVLVAIEKENMEKDISYLDVTNTSRINFGYLGQFRVILGNPGNITSKLNDLPLFVLKIRSQSSDDVKGEIDVSGASSTWRFSPDK